MKVLFLLSLLALFAGCSLYPRYERPEVVAPALWRQDTVEATDAANMCWWKALADPVLDALILEALTANEDIKVAIYTVDQLLAQLGIAKAQLYPQISASGIAEREKISTNATPVLPGTPSVFNLYSLLFNASYLVDLWGQVQSGVDVALANLLSQIQTRRTVVLTIVSATASNYILLRQYDKQLFIAEQTLQTRQEAYKLAVTRFELGFTSQLQVQQALSEMEEAQVQAEQLQILVALQENLISTLIGKPSYAIERGSLLDAFEMPLSVPTYLPSQLLNQRPDILAAEQNLIAANAQIGVARAAFFPQFSLTGSYGAESLTLTSFLTNPSRVWSYGLNLLQEIFTGGELTSNLNLAKAQKETLIHQYRSTILTAFQEVNDALISHKISLQLVQTQKQRVATVKEYFRLSTLRYAEGQIDYLTYMDAERQLFRAELDYAQAQGQSFTTLVDIYKALGGGWVVGADECSLQSECE